MKKDFNHYLYDVFPYYEFITIKEEFIDKIKNYITKVQMGYNVILYFAQKNGDQDIQFIQGISQINEKYHPFIFFWCLKKEKNYYEAHIKNSGLKFDPFNIYCLEKNAYFYDDLKYLLKRRENYYNGEEMFDNMNNDISINLWVLGKPGKEKALL